MKRETKLLNGKPTSMSAYQPAGKKSRDRRLSKEVNRKKGNLINNQSRAIIHHLVKKDSDLAI